MQEAKLCLITEPTVPDLARIGTTVVITGCNHSKAQPIVAELKTASGNPNIDFLLADLSSQFQIRRLWEQFKERYEKPDVLINNAGGFLQLEAFVECYRLGNYSHSSLGLIR